MKRSRRNYTTALVVALLVVAAFGAWYLVDQHRASVKAPVTTTKQGGSSQPTAKQQTTANSQVEKPTSEGSDTKPSAAVTPVITRSSSDGNSTSVFAYVNSPVSGSCVATFSKNGQSVMSQSVTTTLETSYYQCGQMSVPTSSLSAGSWSATVQFSGTNVSGTSAAMNVTVGAS